MSANVPEDEDAALAEKLRGFDTSVPSPARMWNYWVGGKDHFAADREAADEIMAAMPALPAIARSVRYFLIDIVHSLTVDYGIRQFLDIGTGLPTADNTHDVAQRAAPESRIVYADYDPVVLAHARALLTSSPEGKTDYIEADLRETDTILSAAARTLDFSKPVAILLLAVLHFIPDEDDPYAIVRKLMDEVPSGSFLVIVHAPSDRSPRGDGGANPALQRVGRRVHAPAQPGGDPAVLHRPRADRARGRAAVGVAAHGAGRTRQRRGRGGRGQEAVTG